MSGEDSILFWGSSRGNLGGFGGQEMMGFWSLVEVVVEGGCGGGGGGMGFG